MTSLIPAPVRAAEPPSSPFAVLDEIYDLARQSLSEGILSYLEEGAGEEQTLRDNRSAFGHWSVVARQLSGLVDADLTTSVAGIPIAAPILLAPIGSDVLFHPDGAKALVRAAAVHGTVAMVAEASAQSLETYAAATSAPKIMQIHAWGSVTQARAMLLRIEDAGYAGVCVTVDCPTLGWREHTRRQRFEVRPCAWSGNHPNHGESSASSRLTSGLGSDWTWETIAEVRSAARLPFLVKGILTGADARHAAAAGADAVVVSNHGGRQLDGAPATLDQLPEVVEAVGPEVAVLMDGGVRRGLDVLKALALGADAVLIGRAAALGLAAGGQDGVSSVLALMIDELRRNMLLAGVADIASLDTGVLTARRLR